MKQRCHVRNVRVVSIAHGGVCEVKQRAAGDAAGDTHVRNVRVVSIAHGGVWSAMCPWWGV